MLMRHQFYGMTPGSVVAVTGTNKQRRAQRGPSGGCLRIQLQTWRLSVSIRALQACGAGQRT